MIRVVLTDSFESSTATARTTASGFSASNVLDGKPKNVWRSVNTSSQWLKFDLGSSIEINSFNLFNNNLSSGASVKLYGHASDLGTDLSTWQSSASFKTNNSLTFNSNLGSLFLSSSQTYRWWLLELHDPSNTNGFIDIGKVYGGLSSSPTDNFNENFSTSLIDTSRSFRVEGAHKYSVEKQKIKEFRISFNDVSDADRQTIRGWFESKGKTRPFVVALDPDNNALEFTAYATFEDDPQYVGQPNERYTIGLNMLEVK